MSMIIRRLFTLGRGNHLHIYRTGLVMACGVRNASNDNFKTMTDEEWKRRLTPEQYQVTRQHGTERAFTGEYDGFYEKGTYKCVCCSQPLFSSKAKFDSGSGWPSFYEGLQSDGGNHVTEKTDKSYGMVRTEVTCSQCGAHLGHVFNDGPRPTGQRFCINSVSLNFEPKDDAKSKL